MYESTNTKLLQQKLKTIITSINQKQAHRLLDKFIQFTNQKIECNSKEISYKCYEATCTMKSIKTTGYGRTESQALASAIRNLFQSLLEDENYLYVIKQAVKKIIEYSQQKHSDENKQNYNMTKIQMQIHKKTSIKKPPTHNAINNSNYLNLSLNDYSSNSKSRINIDNLNISGSKASQQNNLNKSQDKDAFTIDDQLKKAKQYMRELEIKLKAVTNQNKIMKKQIQFQDLQLKNLKNSNEIFQNNEKLRSISYEYQNKNVLSNTAQHNQSIFQSNQLSNSTIQGKKKNSKVPRLNLQILPNYHAKSNKCLNQLLFAAYQQKQAANKKY